MENLHNLSNAAGSSINGTLDKVEKTLDTTSMGVPGGLASVTLIRENLADAVTRLPFRETNIRDRLKRKKGSGAAASWNVLTAIGVGNSPFAEGGTPTEDDATYGRRSAVYKELGKKKSITDKMLAAGASFMDQEAEQTEVGMREVIQDEEQLIITGDATGSPLEFDGLDTLITTNVIDDNNDALGFRMDLIDNAVQIPWSNHGARATAIYVGYAMKRAINQSLIGDLRVNLNDGNEVAHGVEVGFIQTMVGKLPVIPTFAIATDTVSFGPNGVESIYVVTEQMKGQDVIYMEDLYALGKSYLDRTGAAINFMITEATVLVNRAEEFHTKIENVRVS